MSGLPTAYQAQNNEIDAMSPPHRVTVTVNDNTEVEPSMEHTRQVAFSKSLAETQNAMGPDQGE